MNEKENKDANPKLVANLNGKKLFEGENVSEFLHANGQGAKISEKYFMNGSIVNSIEGITFIDCDFEKVDFMGSGRDLQLVDRIIFIRCKIHGCKFYNFKLFHTSFTKCDFRNVSFGGSSQFSRVSFMDCTGLPNISGIDEVIIEQPARENLLIYPPYETTAQSFLDRRTSWESIRKFGSLPLFSFSATALIVVPIVAWLLGVYNAQVFRVQRWVQGHADTPPPLAQMAASIEPISLPSLMFAGLVGTLFLAVASTLYNLFCPSRVKEFSSDRWMDELGQHAVRYFPKSWSLPWLRALVMTCYVIGGAITTLVLLRKLYQAGEFIVRNTTHTWQW